MVSPEIDEYIFDQAFQVVLKHEGSYTNDPDDTGGATKYGISLRYLRTQHTINADENHDGLIDDRDVFMLSLSDAKSIYYHEFWLRNRYNLIGNNDVAIKIFDLCVNMGGPAANKIFQRAINSTVGNTLCMVDGVIGPKTLSLSRMLDPGDLLKSIRNCAADYYEKIVENNPKMKKYLNGWMTRAYA